MKCLFKKIFIIEGNIGAGKSSLLKLIEKSIPNSIILGEPVTEWKNIGGDNLLNCLYSEPERWCFTFEVCSMISKIKKLKNALKDDSTYIFMERSLYSDKAFHQVSYFLEKIDTKEMLILKDFYNNFKLEYPCPNGIIYINTDVKTCLKRIKERGRKEEQGITEEYLKKLGDQLSTIEYKSPILQIDGNYDQKKSSMIIQNIKDFIKVN